MNLRHAGLQDANIWVSLIFVIYVLWKFNLNVGVVMKQSQCIIFFYYAVCHGSELFTHLAKTDIHDDSFTKSGRK